MTKKAKAKVNPRPRRRQSENFPKNQKLAPPKVEFQRIDAAGKILGRLATEVANILRGKNKPNFRPHLAMGEKVVVTNAAKIKVSGEKETKKVYYRHTGYLGHLKKEAYGDVFRKNPAEVLRRAVWGMLPKNRLRKIWMRNLTIKNGE